MPQFLNAIAARSRGERVRAERRRAESRDVGKSVDFRSGIAASLKDIRCLLEQQDVTAVVVDVDEAQLPLFNEALYSYELAGYNIQQDAQISNRFSISDKILF
jgi:hypothetical protein